MTDPAADPNYHPSFRPPADPNAVIWRYMDFPKFAWTIQEGRLFMPRCSVLAKNDPFEASTPIARYRKMEKIADQAPSAEHRQIVLDNIKKLKGFAAQFYLGYFVSCWYLSDHESDAMWKLYGGSNNYVAIRSTFSNLKACLPSHVYIGRVSYIDYETDDFPNFNMFENVVHKRRAFEHEREVRAVVWQFVAEQSSPDFHDACNEYGYSPTVDLQRLIHGVYVHPLADDWFLEVASKMVSLPNYTFPVQRSTMAAVPVF